MLFKAGDEDTICALSTPPGVGGIAVVRISGEDALSFARQLCMFLPEKPESHRTYFGVLRSREGSEPVDEVLVSFFMHGRSFTGEETIEISCHGGRVIQSSILKELIHCGCRLAKPGEFTYRAFMNGRIDLVQAESVLGLIESRSGQSAKIALRQLQGDLSAHLSGIEERLVGVLANLEASIDFSSEGLLVMSSEELLFNCDGLIASVDRLVSSYKKGRLLKEGIEVALIGRPNVGKSSLLNALLKESRAIVTSEPGTTRDAIEGVITLSGIPVTLVDTAGLREAESEAEKIGIARSKEIAGRADFVFEVVDASDAEEDFLNAGDVPEVSRADECRHLVLNKVDLVDGSLVDAWRAGVLAKGVSADRVFVVSAKTGRGIQEIEERISSLVARQCDAEASSVVVEARHAELLAKTLTSLRATRKLIFENASPEFVAFELQEGVRSIHEILGKKFDEQVIDRVFKEFCLGK